MDIHAMLDADLVLKPMQRQAVPTGLYIALPTGYEAQVRPRSGLAMRQGLTCLNTPGTIDSDYRGEIKVILVNLSEEEQVIHDGDRIAQLVISKYERVEWNLVHQIDESARGDGGFGSTGV